MTAFTTLLALLLAAAPTARAEKERADYEQSLLDELRAITPAAVEDARAGGEAYAARSWQEAITRYEAVARAAPGFSHALRRQCSARLALGDRAAALPLCRRAVAMASLGENELALARALIGADPSASSAPEKAEALRLARSGTDRKPDDASVAGGACQVAYQGWDVPLLDTCSERLARLAPDEAETLVFQSLAAIAHERLGDARALLARARERGFDPEMAARLEDAYTQAEPPLYRYGRPALWIALGWAAGLLFLVALGAALSAATLRAGRLAHARTGAVSGASALLRRTYGAVLWLSCAFFYASIPVVLLAVLAAAGGVYLAFAWIGQIPVKLVIVVAIVVLVTIWAVLKSVWTSVFRSGGERDPGVRLDRAQHPRVAEFLARVAARISTRPVDAVFMTPGSEVAVYERGSMLKQLSGRGERCLILGVAVLDGMKQGELKAVLAHEYGHFANRDTAGGGFALAVRRAVLEMARTLAEGGAATWYNPAWWFVNGFHRAFLRISQGASRLQEILADRWAALAYGGTAFAGGLRHVIERSVRFDAHANRAIREVIDGELALANLYRFAPREPVSEEEVRAAVEQALAAAPSPYDSHPCPKDRIAWVAGVTAAPEPDDAAPAWDLFEDREALERLMTVEVRAAVAANHGVTIPEEETSASPAA